jgi:hypothetical protein
MDVTGMPLSSVIETLQVKSIIWLSDKDRVSVIASLNEVQGLVWHIVAG